MVRRRSKKSKSSAASGNAEVPSLEQMNNELESGRGVFEDDSAQGQIPFSDPNMVTFAAPTPMTCGWVKCDKTEDASAPFKECFSCGTKYCSEECQDLDWRTHHKAAGCVQHSYLFKTTKKEEFPTQMVNPYSCLICPFVVANYDKVGRGVVFMRTNEPIKSYYFDAPVDCYGRAMKREVESMYIPADVFEKDFSAMQGLPMYSQALEQVKVYDPKESFVLVMIARCGWAVVSSIKLTPEYPVCQNLVQTGSDVGPEILLIIDDHEHATGEEDSHKEGKPMLVAAGQGANAEELKAAFEAMKLSQKKKAEEKKKQEEAEKSS